LIGPLDIDPDRTRIVRYLKLVRPAAARSPVFLLRAVANVG
jgi:hypothetical protein